MVLRREGEQQNTGHGSANQRERPELKWARVLPEHRVHSDETTHWRHLHNVSCLHTSGCRTAQKQSFSDDLTATATCSLDLTSWRLGLMAKASSFDQNSQSSMRGSFVFTGCDEYRCRSHCSDYMQKAAL